MNNIELLTWKTGTKWNKSIITQTMILRDPFPDLFIFPSNISGTKPGRSPAEKVPPSIHDSKALCLMDTECRRKCKAHLIPNSGGRGWGEAREEEKEGAHWLDVCPRFPSADGEGRFRVWAARRWREKAIGPDSLFGLCEERPFLTFPALNTPPSLWLCGVVGEPEPPRVSFPEPPSVPKEMGGWPQSWPWRLAGNLGVLEPGRAQVRPNWPENELGYDQIGRMRSVTDSSHECRDSIKTTPTRRPEHHPQGHSSPHFTLLSSPHLYTQLPSFRDE